MAKGNTSAQAGINPKTVLSLAAMLLIAVGITSTAFSQPERTAELFPGLEATNKHETTVIGLVSLDDFKMAILECRDWSPKGNRFVSGRFFLEEGRSYEDKDVKDAPVKIEIVLIHSTNGVIEAREDGKDVLYQFKAETETNHVPTEASLRLNDAGFKTGFDLLSTFSGRTLLIHPAAQCPMPVAIAASPRNKAEAIQSLESALHEKGFAVIPDGSKFEIIVPNELATNVVSNSADLPAAKAEDTLPDGMIYFQNVRFADVRGIYGKLAGREIIQDSDLSGVAITLETKNRLTKSEVLYALDVLLDWQGAKIVNVDDKTAKVIWTNPQKQISSPASPQPAPSSPGFKK